MNKLTTTFGQIFGKFLGEYLLFTSIIWLFGLIINNANLSNYGANSWHFLDIAYISSGILFSVIICIPIFMVFFIKGYEYKIKKVVIYFLLIITAYGSTIIINYELISEENQEISLLITSVILLLNFLLLLFFILYKGIDNKNEKTILDHDKMKDEQLSFDENLNREIIRVKNKAAEIMNKDKSHVSDKKLTINYLMTLLNINEKIERIKSKTKIAEGKSILSIPKRFYFIFLLLLVSAYIFGKVIYPKIPKAIGGGKPEIVQFFYNEKLDGIIDFDRTYELLDETPDEYIVYDPIEECVIFVPHESGKTGAIKYFGKEKKKITISLAADLHLALENTYKRDTVTGEIKTRKSLHFEYFDKLAKYWDSNQSDYYVLLGDMLEAPAVNDTIMYNSLLKIFYERFNNLTQIGKSNLLVGNNDARSFSQLDSFRNKFCSLSADTYNCIEWQKEITEEIYAISLFLPDKRSFDNYDSNLYDSIIMQIPSELEKVLEEKYDEYQFILIFTHQGFIEESHWSGAYRFEEKDEFINDTIAVKRWKNIVDSVKSKLCKYDKTNNSHSNDYPDIVVVSGHYHTGSTIRSLDGIDHIVCPSYNEGHRKSTVFDTTSFPVMDLYFSFGKNKNIEVVFKSLNDDGPEDNRTELSFN